ncbi:MAG: hypothetical protein WCV67_09800, partial [Victivallaceae bacterium]
MNTKMLSRFVAGLAVIAASANLWAMPSYDDVLLVVNDKSPASLEIGAYFKTARKIPDINVVHVSVTDWQAVGSENEYGSMNKDEKKALLDAIKNHMTANKLTDKINYIVLTRGIPMYAASPEFTGTAFHLTDIYVLFNLSESAANYSIPDIFSRNKYFYYYNTDILNKKFSSKMFGYYIVSRLDGPGMINIKQMIDDTGSPAYGSYKKNSGKAKFLTLHQQISAMVQNELKKRNIELVQVPANPVTKQLTATMDTVANGLMFAFFNDVSSSGYGYADLPVDNYFYGSGDMVDQYPFIYRGATFSPGSFATCFRSYPSRQMNRSNGGLLAINTDTAAVTDYQKAYDGSDMKFRHQTCVAYDPVNNQVWCGTGEPALNVNMTFDTPHGTDEFYREHTRNEGGGIAVYDAANGNIVSWINAKDTGSPLKNNRVVKMVYDKASKLMWVMHYKGVQYFDLVSKIWHDVPALQNDFAAGCSIYLDPYDSDKVYFSFYCSDYSYYSKISSRLTGASSSIYEYSKSAQTVKIFTIDTDSMVTGTSPQMVKTSAGTLWVTKGWDNGSSRKIALIRYDLAKSAIAEKLILNDLIPEVKTPPADLSSISIRPPPALVAGPNNTILTPVGCAIAYTAARTSSDGKTTYLAETKNYLVRVTEKSGTASAVEVINDPVLNYTDSAPPDFYARSLIVDPQNSNNVYMALSWPLTTSAIAILAKSTDGGKTWIRHVSGSHKIDCIYDLTINDKTIYAVRGYQASQNLLCDFMAFGLDAFGGGITHATMMYNPSRTTVRAPGFSEYARGPGDIYAATMQSISWITGYCDTQGNNYDKWDSLKTYKFGDAVTDGFSAVYVSAKDNNTGNPLTSVWQLVDISNISDYSPGITCAKYDFVKYKGNTYICLISTSTYAPDSTYGQYFWGETDISNIGAYSSSTQYAYKDLVQYNGAYYIAQQASTGSTPGIVFWQKTSTTVTSVQAPISQAEPMMFLYTDGFNMGEVRFATQSQYPQEGGGGWTGHFLM